MREIRTLRSMSGDGKRGVAAWPKLPRPSSTLQKYPKRLRLPAGKNTHEHMGRIVPGRDARRDPGQEARAVSWESAFWRKAARVRTDPCFRP